MAKKLRIGLISDYQCNGLALLRELEEANKENLISAKKNWLEFDTCTIELVKSECTLGYRFDQIIADKMDIRDDLHTLSASNVPKNAQIIRLSPKKRDFSSICDHDDENMNNHCKQCEYFLFPIGCMYGEVEQGGDR